MVAEITIEQQFYMNLGQIMYQLAQKDVVVRLGQEKSILGKDIVYLIMTIMRAGKSVQLKQAITMDELVLVTEPSIIADTLYERLRKTPT